MKRKLGDFVKFWSFFIFRRVLLSFRVNSAKRLNKPGFFYPDGLVL